MSISVSQGNPYRRERFNVVGLIIKIVFFIKKKKIVSELKAADLN
jgi:hypothetical protein